MKSKLSGDVIFKLIFGFIALGFLAVLIYSFFHSALFYAFDNDELSHVQNIYLISRGNFPYLNFFSIYSPVLHWFLLPLFRFFGFSFATAHYARYLMSFLFVVRMLLMYLLIIKLTSKRLGLFFLVLLFLDTFTVFTNLQIRPDNLMMLFYNAGLLLLYLALAKSKKTDIYIFLAGIFFGLSLIVSIKIILSIAILGAGILYYSYRFKSWDKFTYLAIGILIPVLIFCYSFLIRGDFYLMVQSLLFDAPSSNSAIIQALPPGNFYWPNGTLFGAPGRPLTLIYVWILPLLSAIGVYFSVKKFLIQRNFNNKQFIVFLLAISLTALWFSLFKINSVFIQYYIPLTWLFCFFSAVAIDDFYEDVILKAGWKRFFEIAVLIVFILFCLTTIKSNMWRGDQTSFKQEKWYNDMLAVIPENEKVFSNLIFRPLSYPLPFGYFIGDIPKNILARYDSIESYLAKDNVRYLLIDSYYFGFLPASSVSYIKNNYQMIDDQHSIWLKK